MVLSEGNDWSAVWEDLNKNTNPSGSTGKARAIVYTVEETDVPNGYTSATAGSAASGFVITNTYEFGKLTIQKTFELEEPEEEETEEELIDIPVTKVWRDNDNEDGNRPGSITVHLYADGTEIQSVAIGGEEWTHTFTDLPRKTEEGKIIRYTVSEDPVNMYVSSVNGYTITNTYQPVTKSVSVRKVWNDNNNALGIRPTSIHMTLSNGTSVILSEANGWTAVVTNLPTVVNGEEVRYTWTEQEVVGYHLQGVTTNGDATVFTNAPIEVPHIPDGYKPPHTPKNDFVIFEEYDTALGMELTINHVGDCFD